MLSCGVSALRNPYQINFGLSHWIRIMNKHSCSLAFISMTLCSMNSWRKIKVKSFKFCLDDWISCPYFLWDVDSCVWWWNQSSSSLLGLVKLLMTPLYMSLNTDLLQIAVKLRPSPQKKQLWGDMMCLAHIWLILDKWMLAGWATWATAINTKIIVRKVFFQKVWN